jgi:mRNA interferase MazF
MARGEIERGDIWQYRFAPPDKRRPVLILSRNAALRYLRTATVAPITTTIHGLPSEVRVGSDHGLKTDSVVNLDHIVTIEQSDLKRYVGHLDEKLMAQICLAVAVAFACPGDQ